MLRLIRLAITTNGSGAATVVSSDLHVNGLLYGLIYQPGTLDTGADLTISYVYSELAQTVLTITNAGTSAVSWYPRTSSCGATGTSNSDNLLMIPIIGQPKVVVAQGGASASGALYFLVLED